MVDALFDTARDDDLDARFSMLLLNYDEDRVAELLRQPESLIALSDAGAHVSVLCDAGYATYLLGHWVRERGLFTWEEAVRRLTADAGGDLRHRASAAAWSPARSPTSPASIPTRVGMLPPERVRDFPAGAERYVARADRHRARASSPARSSWSAANGPAPIRGRVLEAARRQRLP